MNKVLYISIQLIILFSIQVQFSQATENVDTKTNLIFQINQNGTNQVNHTIELTNTSSNSFVSEYITELNSNRLEDISVTDNQSKDIPFQVHQTDNSTILQLKFDNPIVGKGKSQQVNIKYSNPDSSSLVGNILEVNVPQVSNIHDFKEYKFSIIVPESFGPPSHISPKPASSDSDNNFNRFHYDLKSNNLGAQLLFGKTQLYRLKASIPLYNNSITPIETQFAIPPDTQYQKVYINSLEPKPQSLETDEDGNWIATFSLEAKQELDVNLDQTITVFNQPQPDFSSPVVDLNKYLKQQDFWEISSDSVQTFSSQHQSASDIYHGIVNDFKYNFARIDNQTTHRLGAKQALTNPDNSLCLEFTDAFIASARANKIPSRLLTGYAYTQNPSLKPLSLVENTLHAWPEYYDLDAKSWKSIDPTWAKTTGGIDYFNSFDFNHIVFAINGNSSTLPQPLGYQQDQNQQIDIDFSSDVPEKISDFKVNVKTPLSTLLGLTNYLSLIISNNSNHAVYQQPAKLFSDTKQVASYEVSQSLPFSTNTYQLELEANLSNLDNELTLEFYDQSYIVSINRLPSYIGLIIFAITSTIATVIALFTIRTRSILVSRGK